MVCFTGSQASFRALRPARLSCAPRTRTSSAGAEPLSLLSALPACVMLAPSSWFFRIRRHINMKEQGWQELYLHASKCLSFRRRVRAQGDMHALPFQFE